MTEYDEPISLFLGDTKGDRPIFEIWEGKNTDEIHIQIDGWNTISLSQKNFDRLIEALNIAKERQKEQI